MFKKVVVVAVLTPWFVQQTSVRQRLFFRPAEMQTERTGAGALLLSAVAGKAVDSTQLTTQLTTQLPTGRNADRKDRP